MKHDGRILIKLTGELFGTNTQKDRQSDQLHAVIQQIAALHKQYNIGIVVGGGNLFRGSIQGKQHHMNAWRAHTVGMFATIMNGLILADLFEQQAIPYSLFSAIPCPQAGLPITPEAVKQALDMNHVMIFSGGTGNPYFTSDTNAVLCALRIGATDLWKASTIDGIYDADPQQNRNAQLLKNLSYQKAIERHLGIMDLSALALAAEHQLRIRVFSIFTPDALLNASRDENFGSIIE